MSTIGIKPVPWDWCLNGVYPSNKTRISQAVYIKKPTTKKVIS